MGLFTPKSKKETAISAATAAVTSAGAWRTLKAVGGAVVGFVTVTAASAAISSARSRDQS